MFFKHVHAIMWFIVDLIYNLFLNLRETSDISSSNRLYAAYNTGVMITGKTVFVRTNWRSCLLFGGFPALLLMDWTGENNSKNSIRKVGIWKKRKHITKA